ncbi:CYTH domain-containing protein [Candidatus Parcubacteria bacterium]|nr:CYTH domain-containing protein [Candidatus Parcubacteria bacterium]
MIEVEEKFELTESAIKEIKANCEFLREVKLHDKYFDFSDNRLMLGDTWLRERNGQVELKYPVCCGGHFNYQEYENIKEICEKLKLKYLESNSWEEICKENGLDIYIDFISVRQKYKCGKFNIDIDNTNFDFELFEVELILDEGESIKEAEEKIFNFIKKHDIKTKHMYSGKGKIYLERFNPELYKKLLDKGVIR